MISNYYFYYDESLESLLAHLDLSRLDGSLNDNIDVKNDIYLIHAIVRLNSNTAIYRKTQIKNQIWEMIKDKCIVDVEFPFTRNIENYRKGYETLFNYCWKQNFSFNKDSKDIKPIYKLVYDKMPIPRKLFDNSIALVFSLVILLIFVHFIDKWLIEDNSWMWHGYRTETYPIIATCICLWISMILVSVGAKKSDRLVYAPVVTCLMFIVYAVLSIIIESIHHGELSISEWGLFKIQFFKRNVSIGLAGLLHIQIIAINYELIADYS